MSNDTLGKVAMSNDTLAGPSSINGFARTTSSQKTPAAVNMPIFEPDEFQAGFDTVGTAEYRAPGHD